MEVSLIPPYLFYSLSPTIYAFVRLVYRFNRIQVSRLFSYL